MRGAAGRQERRRLLPGTEGHVGLQASGLQGPPEERAAGAGEARGSSQRMGTGGRRPGREKSPRSRGPGTETTYPRTEWEGRGHSEGARGGSARAERGRMWGPEGRSPRDAQLTVPPSLMMIFLASMILRFAARFFFFPWVILPSSSPGAPAATPGAAGPSGECRPATTGPSRYESPPPS